MIVGNGVPRDQALVPVNRVTLDFRGFLEALDPKASWPTWREGRKG